jgi:hypothetical protein
MTAPKVLTLTTLVALAAAACDKSPVEIEPTNPATGVTELSADTLFLTALGATGSVTATDGDQTERSPSFVLASEARWHADFAVLDADALAGGAIVAGAPGVANVGVVAFGNDPAPLVVVVEPSAPAVLDFSHEGPTVGGDRPLRLVGWALDAGADWSFAGEPASVVGSGDAWLELSWPVEVREQCEGTHVWAAPRAGGSAVAGMPEVARTIEGEVALASGESLRLPDNDGCLRLAPADADEGMYVLGWVDGRATMGAMHGYSDGYAYWRDYRVSLSDWTHGAPSERYEPFIRSEGLGDWSQSVLPPNDWSAEAHTHGVSVTAGDESCSPDPRFETEPYVVGRRFDIPSDSYSGCENIEVVRVFDNYYAVAVYDELASRLDEAEYARMLARIDSVWGFWMAEGEPLMRHTWVDERVRTSEHHDQVLILLTGEGNEGLAAFSGVYGRYYVRIDEGAASTRSAELILGMLTHELTHGWDMLYRVRTMPAGEGFRGGSLMWAGEGVAELARWEVIRRWAGARYDQQFERQGAKRHFYPWLNSRQFNFFRGYQRASGFLLDQVARVRDAGLSHEDALRQVMRGAVEGWNGYGREGERREGLARRMERAGLNGWDPIDALVTWNLTTATSNLHDNPVYQDATFAFPRGGHWWSNWASSGNPMPLAVFKSGERGYLDVELRGQNNEYVDLAVGRDGMALQLETEAMTDTPLTAWKLVRAEYRTP